MKRKTKSNLPLAFEAAASSDMPRLDRPLSLSAQVERLLRQAIAEGRFAGGKLPTEVELAEQPGLRMISNLLGAAPADIAFDAPVQVCFERHPAGQQLPMFRLVPA